MKQDHFSQTIYYHHDWLTACVISILLHILIFFCLARIFSSNHIDLLPSFKMGETALVLTILPVKASASFNEHRQPVYAERKEINDLSVKAQLAKSCIHSQTINNRNISQIHPPEKIQPMRAANATEKPIDKQSDLQENTPIQGVTGTIHPASDIHPYYPLGSRLRGEEGVVKLKISVNSLGALVHLDLIQGSGYPALDHAAISAVERTRFTPAKERGQAVNSETILIFRFHLVD